MAVLPASIHPGDIVSVQTGKCRNSRITIFNPKRKTIANVNGSFPFPIRKNIEIIVMTIPRIG